MPAHVLRSTLALLSLQFIPLDVFASQCSDGPNLNETSGVNINVNFGNSTADETNKQITQVYQINSPKRQSCQGATTARK